MRIGQLIIEGTEGEKIPEVTEAAEKYRAARDARMKLTTKEVATKDKLLEVMAKHDLKIYEDTDSQLRAEVSQADPNVKVKGLEDTGAPD